MATLLQETEENLTILALGPLTDVAFIVLNFPQVLDKIEEIVFLHPNQRGHRIVAEYIYEYMKENILTQQTGQRSRFIVDPAYKLGLYRYS